jgi:RNA-directed DNA polymerase
MRGVVHPAGVEEPITRERIASEPGMSRVWPSPDDAGGPHREDEESKPMMHGGGKSDEAVVARKPANAAAQAAAEAVERRAEAKGNAGRHSTDRMQSRGGVSQVLDRIRGAASNA